jgi:hypothetical protein
MRMGVRLFTAFVFAMRAPFIRRHTERWCLPNMGIHHDRITNRPRRVITRIRARPRRSRVITTRNRSSSSAGIALSRPARKGPACAIAHHRRAGYVRSPLGFATLSHFCALDPVSAHYVKHHFVRGYEVVCDDATMTLPPNRFGAHYCGGALVPEMAQPSEASTELLSHRIVGIIMKTLVLPKPIHCGRDVALMSAEAAESRKVLIPNLEIRQHCRKCRD